MVHEIKPKCTAQILPPCYLEQPAIPTAHEEPEADTVAPDDCDDDPDSHTYNYVDRGDINKPRQASQDIQAADEEGDTTQPSSDQQSGSHTTNNTNNVPGALQQDNNKEQPANRTEHEETEADPVAPDDCDDDPDSHTYNYVDRDDINNLRQASQDIQAANEEGDTTQPSSDQQGGSHTTNNTNNLPGQDNNKGVNVALDKMAYQTSTNMTYGLYAAVPSRAVDGITSTHMRTGSCTHTEEEDNPAWWVNLGQPYMIERVVIFNRRDCCVERVNPFNIHIGDSKEVIRNPKCGGDHWIEVNKPSVSIPCQGMWGQYAGVRLPGSKRILSLCEVQVFSGVNVAVHKMAYQTSTNMTYGLYAAVPSRAVDGITSTHMRTGSCTHTEEEDNPAWWVNLGQPYMIERVVIFNRRDCCVERVNPFNIHIGDSKEVIRNPKCGGGHWIEVNKPSVSIPCQGMWGQYVGVRLPGSKRILSLCEVQVFSAGETLVISDANYGRTSTSHACPCISNCVTNCSAANSLSIVNDSCQGLQQCAVNASNDVFGDPCTLTLKYLETTYHCAPG
ncbi:PREDICTED: uncharacterized protein LOC109475075 [Branchiostoma belcheri]|uniref:Uncharacterized protein LOC109475075 n=1 Tax=Branchiostoma belcheri TaxID=7741 RepID=A0A6P4ZJB6_BRABE|nr:PREDICTED: uncharacterized protein LOC109475075 [Branchiostoma belcheri]